MVSESTFLVDEFASTSDKAPLFLTEILRVIDSLQLTAEKSTATPADWKHGEDGTLQLMHLSLRFTLYTFFMTFESLTHPAMFPSCILLSHCQLSAYRCHGRRDIRKRRIPYCRGPF